MSSSNQPRYTGRKHQIAVKKAEKHTTPKRKRHPDRSAPPPLPPPGAAAAAMKELVDNGILKRGANLAPGVAERLAKATRRGR
jgi:hypothetical protein